MHAICTERAFETPTISCLSGAVLPSAHELDYRACVCLPGRHATNPGATILTCSSKRFFPVLSQRRCANISASETAA